MKIRTTNEHITQLAPNQIFVFGSNLAGIHAGGAARLAHTKFGAEWGVGSGATGQCYAIPTMQGGTETIAPYVKDLIEYAQKHPDKQFLVTEIGCGIAGFTPAQIAPLFKEAVNIDNISLPARFWQYL
ncbi:MAG: A1S_2505 family phage non-structural protein [Marinifilaceae bacterium]